MNKTVKNILIYVLIPLVFFVSAFFIIRGSKEAAELKYYEIVSLVRNNEISEFQLNLHSGELKYVKRDEPKTTYSYKMASPELFYNDVNEIGIGSVKVYCLIVFHNKFINVIIE